MKYIIIDPDGANSSVRLSDTYDQDAMIKGRIIVIQCEESGWGIRRLKLGVLHHPGIPMVKYVEGLL